MLRSRLVEPAVALSAILCDRRTRSDGDVRVLVLNAGLIVNAREDRMVLDEVLRLTGVTSVPQ
jgi:hypothetical protein